MCNHATLYHIEENRYEMSGSVCLSANPSQQQGCEALCSLHFSALWTWLASKIMLTSTGGIHSAELNNSW